MKLTVFLAALCFRACLLQSAAQLIKPLRYDEDYRFLKNDTAQIGQKSVKYIPLGKAGNSYLSLGGSFRVQYFHILNDGWGDFRERQYSYVFSRYLAYIDFHSGPHFRFFSEIQGGMVNAKADTSPTDENPLDLHQAFAEFKHPSGSPFQLTFRLGRQELQYGSSRLISVREGPNTRQSFDGAKLILKNAHWQSDYFYTHYVRGRKGIFDDRPGSNLKFWGMYHVVENVPVIQNADLYYLGLFRKDARFDDGVGRENRHTLGTRLWGHKGALKYDLEAVYQFGEFGSGPINAWTTSAHIDFQLNDLCLRPELGLKTELISGDMHNGDGRLGTFNPLFPRGAYFGLAALVGPANLIDFHPDINLSISENLSINADWDAFWRFSTSDGLYGPNGTLILSGKDISQQFIGNQFATVLAFEPGTDASFGAEFTLFLPGDYLRHASPGKAIFFAGVTAQFKF